MRTVSVIIAIELIIGIPLGAANRLIVHVGTWNVDGKGPKGDIDELLGLKSSPPNDLILVGIQELVSTSLLGAIEKALIGEKWSKTMEKMFKQKGYTKVKTHTMFGIGNYVYILENHSVSLDKKSIKVEEVKTGFLNKFANKGGIIISFDLYGKGFTVISSHLPGHFENNDKRVSAYQKIFNSTKRLKNNFMVWYGDLNFMVDKNDSDIRQDIKEYKYTQLLEHDQLKMCRKNKTVFDGWLEAPINFQPTYKYEPGKNNYSKKRRPSWTDRVLYRRKGNVYVSAGNYRRLEYNRSDHRPVIAEFKVFF